MFDDDYFLSSFGNYVIDMPERNDFDDDTKEEADGNDKDE